ncbi:MAG: DNA polymerase III subunit delta [Opitutales bacterium]|nr:DNA polymerase III subunit delta [Opitutales bacterium]
MSLNNIMFVYGGDDFLVDRRARALYDSHCPNGEIFQYNPKTDLNTFINNIAESLRTIPLFSPTNNIWIRGINLSTISDAQQSAFSTLLNILQKTDKDNIIIISASPIDKRKKIFKEFSQLFNGQEVSDINEKTTYSFIDDVCASNNVKISHDAADAIQNLIGQNTRLLKLELDKLATYIHGDHTTITLDDVNTMIEATDDGDFFQQIEQFYSSDINETFNTLERYFYFNHEARPLLAGLQNRTRLMVQLRALVDAKLLPTNGAITANQLQNISQKMYCDNQAKSTYNIFSQNPWYLSKLLPTVHRYSLPQLEKLQVAIMDAIAESTEKYDDQLTVIKQLAYKFATYCITR